MGVEKSLRGGRSELRCVSIESSEYPRDLRRKSRINDGAYEGYLGGRLC